MKLEFDITDPIDASFKIKIITTNNKYAIERTVNDLNNIIAMLNTVKEAFND